MFSGPNNRVFIYHGGHGGSGLLYYPNETLMTVKQLQTALRTMQKKNMYKELVLYLLSCYSGSMFDHQLTDKQHSKLCLFVNK